VPGLVGVATAAATRERPVGSIGPMASQSLYRKHRPQRFSELVGQEHVTIALRNSVREGRVGHAYLFSGPRGTGKTTTARLLAKALNCLDLGDDGEPCGVCDNCAAIAAGTFPDLFELDAASNRGVDAMRDLIQSVSLGLGATSRRKVYVIDEVHMLTTEASNTLLKTLEEPPAHVVFALATTDPQKVLPTIRSRTQHFEFTLLSREQLVGHLVDVLGREGVETDDETLDLVARRAAGSARDALSILDQALAIGAGKLDAQQVLGAFGDTPFEHRLCVLEAVAGEDVAGALAGVDEALRAGIDPRRLADDLLRTLRDAFVLATAGGRVPYDGPEEEATRVGALAEAMGAAATVRGIETLGQAIVDIRGALVPDPRLVLEVAVVRCARRDAAGDLDALRDRVDRLERRVAELASGTPRAADAAPASPPTARPAPRGAPDGPGPARAAGPRSALGAHMGQKRRPPEPVPAPTPPAVPPAETSEPAAGAAPDLPPLELDEVILAWAPALDALSPPLRAVVQDAQPIGVEGEVVVLGAPPKRLARMREKFRAEADTIKGALHAGLGRTPKLKLVAHEGFAGTDAGPAPAPRRRAPARPRGGAPAASAEPDAPPPPGDDDVVDLDELVDATDAPAALDSTTRLVEAFGAEVVEERPRD